MKKIVSLFCVLMSCHLVGDPIVWPTMPETISSSGVNSTAVQVAMDGDGNSVAVWNESGSIKSRTALSGASWSSMVTLSSSGSLSPRLVVDLSGNATATWLESGALKTATKPFGSSWSAVSTIAASGVTMPHLGVDDGGDVLAIWCEGGAVKSATKLFGGSWSTADTLSAAGTDPQVAINASGSAVAVWHAINPISGMDAIFANQKEIAGAWGTAQSISSPSQFSVYPKVAISDSGNVFAAWFTYRLTGTQYSNVAVQASIHPAGGFGWTPPASSSTPSVVNPQLLFLKVLYNLSGDAIAVWTNTVDGSYYSIESSVLATNGGFTLPHQILGDIYSFSCDVAMNKNGAAMLAYSTSNGGTTGIQIQTLNSIVGGVTNEIWSNQQVVSSYDNNAYPKIALINHDNTDVDGIVAWATFDGSNRVIQAVTGNAPLLQPPTSLMVSQNSTNFGAFTEYYNEISWTASSSPDASFYLIYRNGIYIGSSAEGETTYIDHNQVLGEDAVYGVATFNNSGIDQSSIAYINLVL